MMVNLEITDWVCMSVCWYDYLVLLVFTLVIVDFHMIVGLYVL